MARGPLSYLPSHALTLLREVGRHLLRRPVVGICAVARTDDGRVLLIRRADTGEWCLPGGTLEWGETLRSALDRELAEEAGVRLRAVGRLTGVYSRPDRDPRFHAVTVCARVAIDDEVKGPKNPLEVREARLFAPADLPRPLSMNMTDVLDDALADRAPVLE